jgi:maltose O-acetyltransferase
MRLPIACCPARGEVPRRDPPPTRERIFCAYAARIAAPLPYDPLPSNTALAAARQSPPAAILPRIPWQAFRMTEKDKMLAGALYDPFDPELVAGRTRARDLCQALNATREGDAEERRRLLVALFGAGGDSVWMQPPFFCDYGTNITLGERVFFNFNCVVLDVCRVTIGDFTLFGPGVQILTPLHPMDATLRRTQELGKPIEIGADVWVGGGALILPGVRIGARAVIGAGSVVTRDVPDGAFAAGNPCRVIRDAA